MKAHRLASYFPIMEDEKFEKFKEDIKENGQLEPIVTFDNQILDGLNRYRACTELGITPTFKAYEGKDPLNYVISVNIHRRHLNESQLGIISVEMFPEFERRIKKAKQSPTGLEGEGFVKSKDGFVRVAEQVASEFGISKNTVKRSKRIIEQAPEKVSDIMKGKTSAFTADSEIRIEKAKERQGIQQEKENDKIHQKRSQAVSDYYEATKRFKGDIELAIISAERGGFDPSGKNFLLKKNDSIRELMQKLEDLL